MGSFAYAVFQLSVFRWPEQNPSGSEFADSDPDMGD
jgi:hypothetical protein